METIDYYYNKNNSIAKRTIHIFYNIYKEIKYYENGDILSINYILKNNNNNENEVFDYI